MAAFFVAFDTEFLLKKRVYYFNYKNKSFKLISGSKKYQNCLGTIINNANYDNEWKDALKISLEFLSCLSWSWNQKVIFSGTAGSGRFQDLRALNRHYVVEKKLQSLGGGDIDVMPNLKNERQRKILGLFREMKIAQRFLPAYEFLCYWRLLENAHQTDNPEKIIYNLTGWQFFKQAILLKSKKFRTKQEIYQFLKDEIRHATAHAYRTRGSRSVMDTDNPDHIMQLKILNSAIGNRIQRHLERKIRITEKLNLFKIRGIRYPIWMTENEYINRL